jgi:serine/threonine protein kinase
MSQEAVLAIAGQLIDILQYLHDLEPAVVHRDFTPDNLIIDGEGRIKLVDFGVAIEGGQQSRSNIVGKQNYLPPEQVAGKACPQSDIYAMGATLYYLLTGLEPEPLSQSNPKDINASVGEALNELVQSATALDLSQRLADAQTARDILANHSSESVVIKMPEQEKAGVKVRRKKEQI